ncbi:hypothetical protein [Methylopila sp. M107]|uniref:hypothetical protein n=1 Tax=Methylopila sp. M107 TaxID=1101190 RepID=UPI00037FB65A|nr:hypothetical protein [Methylopila sp. M107]
MGAPENMLDAEELETVGSGVQDADGHGREDKILVDEVQGLSGGVRDGPTLCAIETLACAA